MLKFFGAVIIIIGVFVTCIRPLAESIKQGLDLQGGTHIVLEAQDTPDAPVTDDSVNRAVTIVERRINEMGLTEPIVQKEGSRRIIVELPGEKNPEKAIETIGKTAVMEFKDESGTTRMTGNDLKNAKEQKDNSGKNVVAIEFTDEGAKKFADLTAANVGHKISITLDGDVLTAPVVNEAITGGKAVITGNNSLEEAKNLAILLRSGALPVQLKVLEVRTIGPSLGQDSKDKSERAFAIGILLIMLFLVVVYRMSGVVANVALLVYVLILLALLKYLDANVSVMIAAIVLITMGAGTVKGFAVNLALGIVVSMFTAIVVSRSLLTWFINTELIKSPWFYGLNRKLDKEDTKGGQA